MGVLNKVRCAIGWHPRFDIIQSFGSAQHIGCPHCGAEKGIHHGMRAVVPWDAELADLYDMLGYETSAATAKWQEYRKAAGFVSA